MTVHTNIHRRDVGMLAFLGTTMAIKTVHLVNAGVNRMGIKDGLFGLIIFRPAQSLRALECIITPYHKQYDRAKGDIGFILIERNRFR